MTAAPEHQTHLTKAELVDVAEGRLASTRVAHLHACGRCREEAEALCELLSEVAEVSAPEPSPLFWSHMAKRVADSVARDSARRRRAPWRWSGPSHVATAAATATVVLAVVIGVLLVRTPNDGRGVPVVTDDRRVQVSDVIADDDGFDQPSTHADDADWTLLLTVAESVDWMEADTDLLVVDQETVEEAVFELSDDERRTLVRLLEDELQESRGL